MAAVPEYAHDSAGDMNKWQGRKGHGGRSLKLYTSDGSQEFRQNIQDRRSEG